MTLSNVSHGQFLCAWVDSSTAGKYCAAGAQRKYLLYICLVKKLLSFYPTSSFFSTLMGSEVNWSQCVSFFLFTAADSEEGCDCMLVVRMRKSSWMAAPRWWRKLSSFLKRTLNVFKWVIRALKWRCVFSVQVQGRLRSLWITWGWGGRWCCCMCWRC